MPDGNAAAQRVLSVALSLRTDYCVSFLGLTHGDNFSGRFAGFDYINLPYPSKIKDWVMHLTGERELGYIKKINPDIVIAYNFPAIGLHRITEYCRKRKIKIIGDITEWYHPHNVLKWLDTTLRMRVFNKRVDGLIVISRFLKEYYYKQKTVLIPPTVDLNDKKWNRTNCFFDNNAIKLLYAGSPGRGDKDRLDNLFTTMGRFTNLQLDIIGINEDGFHLAYPATIIPPNVRFHGRKTHGETINLLKRSDFSIFFRFPSRVNNAGFPTKFVEAQSAGVPVIANHFSDLDEYVVEGKNGFLATDISVAGIDAVLRQVSTLSRQDVYDMRSYTQSHNHFDYRNYKTLLTNFMHSV